MKDAIKRTIKQNLKWLVLLLCIIIFLVIIENVLKKEILQFDTYVYTHVSKMISNPVTSLFKIITNLGGAFIIISVTAGILVLFKNKRYGLYTFLNLAIIVLLNQTLKFVIQRPRPTEYRIIDENGYSFPSGHSMASMAFYGFLIYLIYKNVENKYLKWTLCVILTLLIFTIGISRIYLGVHYASDVLGGFCLSIAYLILYTKVIAKRV